MSSAAMTIVPKRQSKIRKVILITSNKGGTGKTTIGVNLASAAAQLGLSVCALDFDTQHNFDHWAVRRRRFPLPQIHVIAGILKNYQQMMLDTAGYEIVVIDTPPAIVTNEDRHAMMSLVRSADFILVPTQTSVLDIESVVPWIKVMQTEKKKMGDGNAIAFLINRVNLRSNEIRDAQSYLNMHGRVCTETVRDLTAIQRSMKSGHSIVEAMSDTEKGKKDYMGVWYWIEREMGIAP